MLRKNRAFGGWVKETSSKLLAFRGWVLHSFVTPIPPVGALVQISSPGGAFVKIEQDIPIYGISNISMNFKAISSIGEGGDDE